ncbi:MAG: hypothetical protein U1E10_19595 [Bdellovibrionales bacterium]|nr:hypothetical protein [Bdellovibrionales bacterium]
MATNKFDSTDIIKGRIDNLGISWAYDDDPEKRFPMLFFTPDMNDKTNHHHIRLTIAQARTLKNWLDNFLLENAASTNRRQKRKR